MIDGHPLVWLWLVALVGAVSVGPADPLASAALAGALALTGLVARGPRAASFLVGMIGAAAVAVLWLVWALLVPTAAGSGTALFTLPSMSVGPGVTLGGTVTTTTLQFALGGALAASSLCLALGVAGQLVRARQWLSLARLTGPLAPAFGWLCCAGEACAEVASQKRQGRTPGAGAWIAAVRALARGIPNVTARHLLRRRGTDLAQAAAAAALTTALLLRPQIGSVPLALSALLIPLATLWPVLAPRRAVAHA